MLHNLGKYIQFVTSTPKVKEERASQEKFKETFECEYVPKKIQIYLDNSSDENFDLVEEEIGLKSKDFKQKNGKPLNTSPLFYGKAFFNKLDRNRSDEMDSLLKTSTINSDIESEGQYLNKAKTNTSLERGGTSLDDLFPPEKSKTLLAALIMLLNFMLTVVSLSLVHDRVPNRTTYGPLPDIILDNIPDYGMALNISELILIFLSVLSLVVIGMHKYSSIVFRRLFLIMSILYFYRAVTMYVTVLPIASRTYVCAAQLENVTVLDIFRRVFPLTSGFGLSLFGKHVYCGDYIFSGHTVILVLCSLMISEYSSKKFWIFHGICWMLSWFGIIMLELSHGHYVVDVIIAYFITTRVFWIYHSLANNSSLKKSEHNFLNRVWWFRVFLYFEKNVQAPLPNEFKAPC